MKPAKYFPQAFTYTYKSGYEDVSIGSGSYGMPYYQERPYAIQKQHQVEKFVEIND